MTDNINDQERVVFIDGIQSDEAAELSQKYKFGIFFTENKNTNEETGKSESSGTGDIYKGGINYTAFKGIGKNTIDFNDGHIIGLSWDPTTGLVSLNNKYTLKNIVIGRFFYCNKNNQTGKYEESTYDNIPVISENTLYSPTNVFGFKCNFSFIKNETQNSDKEVIIDDSDSEIQHSRLINFKYNNEYLINIQHENSDADGIYYFKICKDITDDNGYLFGESYYDTNIKLNLNIKGKVINEDLEFSQNIYTGVESSSLQNETHNYNRIPIEIQLKPYNGISDLYGNNINVNLQINNVDKSICSFYQNDLSILQLKGSEFDKNGKKTVYLNLKKKYYGINIIAYINKLNTDINYRIIKNTTVNISEYHNYANEINITDSSYNIIENDISIINGGDTDKNNNLKYVTVYGLINTSDSQICTEDVEFSIYDKNTNVKFVDENDVLVDSLTVNSQELVNGYTLTKPIKILSGSTADKVTIIAKTKKSSNIYIENYININVNIPVESFICENPVTITKNHNSFIKLTHVTPINTTDIPYLTITNTDYIIETGEINKDGDSFYIGVKGLITQDIFTTINFGNISKNIEVNITEDKIYCENITIDSIYEYDTDDFTKLIDKTACKISTEYKIKGTIKPGNTNMSYQTNTSIPYLYSIKDRKLGNSDLIFKNIIVKNTYTSDSSEFTANMICYKIGTYDIYGACEGYLSESYQVNFADNTVTADTVKICDYQGNEINTENPEIEIPLGKTNGIILNIRYFHLLYDGTLNENIVNGNKKVTWKAYSKDKDNNLTEITSIKFENQDDNYTQVYVYYNDTTLVSNTYIIKAYLDADNNIYDTCEINLVNSEIKIINLPKYINYYIKEEDTENKDFVKLIQATVDNDFNEGIVMWSLYNNITETNQFDISNVQLVSTDIENECALHIHYYSDGKFTLRATSPTNPEIYAECIINVIKIIGSNYPKTISAADENGILYSEIKIENGSSGKYIYSYFNYEDNSLYKNGINVNYSVVKNNGGSPSNEAETSIIEINSVGCIKPILYGICWVKMTDDEDSSVIGYIKVTVHQSIKSIEIYNSGIFETSGIWDDEYINISKYIKFIPSAVSDNSVTYSSKNLLNIENITGSDSKEYTYITSEGTGILNIKANDGSVLSDGTITYKELNQKIKVNKHPTSIEVENELELSLSAVQNSVNHIWTSPTFNIDTQDIDNLQINASTTNEYISIVNDGNIIATTDNIENKYSVSVKVNDFNSLANYIDATEENKIKINIDFMWGSQILSSDGNYNVKEYKNGIYTDNYNLRKITKTIKLIIIS